MTELDEQLLVKITQQVDGSFTASPLHPLAAGTGSVMTWEDVWAYCATLNAQPVFTPEDYLAFEKSQRGVPSGG